MISPVNIVFPRRVWQKVSLPSSLGLSCTTPAANVQVCLWLFIVPWSVFVPHCLDDCSFVVSFKIRTCESSSFVLFEDRFAFSAPFASPRGM